MGFHVAHPRVLRLVFLLLSEVQEDVEAWKVGVVLDSCKQLLVLKHADLTDSLHGPGHGRSFLVTVGKRSGVLPLRFAASVVGTCRYKSSVSTCCTRQATVRHPP